MVFGYLVESHIIIRLPDRVVFVVVLGRANAFVWSTIRLLALEDLRKHMVKRSALLVMAIFGGVILPLVFEKVAQLTGDMQMSYLVGIVCYAMVLMYGMKWHKMSGWKV